MAGARGARAVARRRRLRAAVPAARVGRGRGRPRGDHRRRTRASGGAVSLAQSRPARRGDVHPGPPAMSRIEAIISDFGGVLTSPLVDSFVGALDSSGISLEQMGTAMAAI